jgi:hypothetical protein
VRAHWQAAAALVQVVQVRQVEFLVLVVGLEHPMPLLEQQIIGESQVAVQVLQVVKAEPTVLVVVVLSIQALLV